uniref:Uncharacterized protein n=1 Tax=Urocitellus parryii TaxID=9999 RepID=A0A8D2HUL9_UROPR
AAQPAPVPRETFMEAQDYEVGPMDSLSTQLLRAGKAKAVAHSAPASHRTSEDGDDPEAGGAREVFDVLVLSPLWVLLSIGCEGTLGRPFLKKCLFIYF